MPAQGDRSVADDRTEDGHRIGCPTHTQAAHGISEPTPKGWIVVDAGLDDGQGCGRALLSGVTEGRLHEVLDGQVDVCGRSDDEGIFAARLGMQTHVGTPTVEEIGGRE